jgi:peptide/nickel transport system permease protein
MSDQDVNLFQQIEAETRDTAPMDQNERVRATLEQWVVVPFKIIWDDTRTKVGSVILAFYILMGTLGVVVIDTPTMNEGPSFLGMFNPQYTNHPLGLPDFSVAGWTYTGIWTFPFGTDNWGVDLLSQAVHATPPMLLMALSGGLFMTALAVVVGTVAGYRRGRIGQILMTITDIQITIPGLPLLIVLAMAIEPKNPILVGILLSIDGWPNLARALYSQVLSIREDSYVEASRVIGEGSTSIIRDDVLPNVMPYVMIHFMQNTIRVIHASVALFFLGALPFTHTNWGVMLERAFNNVSLMTLSGWNWLLLPILLIGGLGFGTILLSQGMDRLFNPRVRARHTDTDIDDLGGH